MIDKVLLGIVTLLIMFSLYHFIYDVYLILYRMYYDSGYFTQLMNTYNTFVATWF